MKQRKDGRFTKKKRVNGEQIFGYGPTPEAAEDDLRQKIQTMQSISEALPKEPTLHEVAQHLWAPTITHLEPASISRYTGCYKKWVRDRLGLTPIKLLTRGMVQNWVNVVSKELGAASVEFALNLLASICNRAVDEGILPQSPVRRITKPKRPEKRERILSFESALAMLERMDETPISCPVYLASVLGLRQGEIAALKWEHIDRVQGTIRITVQRQAKKGAGVVEKSLKSTGSKRRLQVPQAVLAGIDARGDLDSEFVCTYLGEPWVPNTIWELWTWLRPPELGAWTFHDLRHLAAGLLHASGASLMEIAAILGHRKVDTTQIYTALQEGQTGSALERLSTRIHVDKS